MHLILGKTSGELMFSLLAIVFSIWTYLTGSLSLSVYDPLLFVFLKKCWLSCCFLFLHVIRGPLRLKNDLVIFFFPNIGKRVCMAPKRGFNVSWIILPLAWNAWYEPNQKFLSYSHSQLKFQVWRKSYAQNKIPVDQSSVFFNNQELEKQKKKKQKQQQHELKF